MDLAIYIHELWGLQGEVNLPGVGYFAQKRIAGYYDENEKKFYPPRHEVTFDPDPREDDGLAAYISKKKNISPASAKYFIEKYTAGLKQQAAEQQVDIVGLGKLYYEYSALTFKADKKSEENDPAFFGFSPVKTHKGGGQAVTIDAPPVIVPPHVIKATQEEEHKLVPATPAPAIDTEPDVVIPPNVTEPQAEETLAEATPQVTFATTRTFIPPPVYVDPEPDHRARNMWVVILLIVIIVLLIFGIAYQYNPGLFSPNSKEDTVVIVKTLPPGIKEDSVAKTDTPAKSIAPAQTINRPVDTFAEVHYDIWGGAYKTLTKVKIVIADYKKLGLQASILTHTPGKLYHINLGTFFNRNEAIKFEDSIKNIKGIDKTPISLQPYIPQKK